jgi:hypothetical protein
MSDWLSRLRETSNVRHSEPAPAGEEFFFGFKPRWIPCFARSDDAGWFFQKLFSEPLFFPQCKAKPDRL